MDNKKLISHSHISICNISIFLSTQSFFTNAPLTETKVLDLFSDLIRTSLYVCRFAAPSLTISCISNLFMKASAAEVVWATYRQLRPREFSSHTLTGCTISDVTWSGKSDSRNDSCAQGSHRTADGYTYNQRKDWKTADGCTTWRCSTVQRNRA